MKGEQDVLEKVIITPRGPVIGSLNKRKDGTVSALSMRAIWLDILPVNGLINIHKAGSFKDFRDACQDWPLSSLSMVYACYGMLIRTILGFIASIYFILEIRLKRQG